MTDIPPTSATASDALLMWLNRIAALAAPIALALGAVLPSLGARGQSIAYITAGILAATSAILYYRRRRKEPPPPPQKPEANPEAAVLRGLLPFEDGDRLIGRAADIQALVAITRITGFRFGVVWGESGSGKTSLLRAGLVPAIRAHGMRPVYIARPTADPLKAIIDQLPPIHQSQANGEVKTYADLVDRIAANTDGGMTLVILDQFEEFFLLNKDRDTQEGFRRILEGCVSRAVSPITFLVGIRDDHFARLQRLAPEVPDPTHPHTTYELENLRVRQAAEVLAASAQIDNTKFEVGLVDQMVEDLARDEFVRASELQLVATHLKRRGITSAARYEAVGGAHGILGSYIKDEIQQASDRELARLALRMLCSEDGQRKSPVDRSLDDLLTGLKHHGSTTATAENVLATMQRLMAARIVRRSDDGFNLLHDYFAPLVRAATEGLETEVEKANRLLRRYAAEFREDSTTRIPRHHLWQIRRHTTLTAQTDEYTPLLRRSIIAAAAPTILPVGFALLLLCTGYAFLANSYYLSTAKANYKGGSPVIVVRAGHPALKLLPGFDDILVETDFSMYDISDASPEAIDAFPRETIRGWRSRRTNGYRSWIESIVAATSKLDQGRTNRTLGNAEMARDTLMSILGDQGFPYAAFSVGAISIAPNSKLTPQFAQPLRRLILDTSQAASSRPSAILAFSEVSGEDVSDTTLHSLFRLSLRPVRALMRRERNAIDQPTDFRPYQYALQSLAFSSTASITREDVDSLFGYYEDSTLDVFAKRNLVDVLESVGSSRPELRSYVLLKMIEEIRHEKYGATRKDGSGWLTSQLMRNAAAVARDDPDAVPSEAVQALGNDLLAISSSSKSFGSPFILFSILGKAKPSAVDQRIIAKLNALMRDDKQQAWVRGLSAVALTRLGTARTEWHSNEAETRCLDILKEQPGSSASWLKPYASTALIELDVGENIPEILRNNATKIVQGGLSSLTEGSDWSPFDLYNDVQWTALIPHLATRVPNLINPTTVKLVIEAIEKPRFSGNENTAAEILISLAPFVPTDVLSYRDRLFQLAGGGLDPVTELRITHGLVLDALARARFQKQWRENPKTTLKIMSELLSDELSSDHRLEGMCGLFLLKVNQTGETAVDSLLTGLRVSTSPVVRIAAHKTREMLRVYQIAKDVEQDQRLFSRSRARLEFLRRSGEDHIAFAAQIGLEKLSR